MMRALQLLIFLPLMMWGITLSPDIQTLTQAVFLATPGNNPLYQTPEYDDSSWTKISLPTNLQVVLGKADDYWIRFHFYVPEDYHSLSAIHVGFIYSADAFYLNGKLMGGHGVYPTYENAHDTLRWYLLHPLIPGKTNTIAWHIKGKFQGYTGMVRYPIRIGPAVPLFFEIYGTDFITLVFLSMYVIVMMYFLLFFFRRRDQKDYLWFGLFLADLIVYSLCRIQIKFFFFTNYTLWKQIEYITYYLLFPFFLMFIRTSLDDKNKIGQYILIFDLLLGIPGYIIAFLANWPLANSYNFRFYQITVFPLTIGYTFFLFIKKYKTSSQARFFLGGFVFILMAVIYDVSVARGVIKTAPIMPFAFFGFIIFYAFILANRFINLYQEVEKLNAHLEDLVADRTKQLEESNRRLLESQQQIQFELSLAQRIQQSMMPSDFQFLKPTTAYGVYIPMEELGGDFYDLYQKRDASLHIMIGDVSGHGVPAALIAMTAKALLSYYSETSQDVGFILSSVNKELCRQLESVENYLTLWYGIIDQTTGTCSYVNAGHPRMFLLSSDGTIQTLEAKTPFLGKFPELTFTSSSITLKPSDKLILYTDGVTETRNREGKLFGEGQFMDLLTANASLTPEALAKLILSRLDKFRDNQKISDDTTFFIVEFPAFSETKRLATYEVATLYEKALQNYNHGNLQEAQKLLENLRENVELTDEERYRILLLLGNLYIQLNRREKAYQVWQDALSIHPENERLSKNIAILQKELRKDK